MVQSPRERWRLDTYQINNSTTNSIGRDQSFVRYDLYVDKKAHRRNEPPDFELKCFYAQLEHIFSWELPEDHSLEGSQLRKLFAVVRNCITTGLDATTKPVTYTKMATSLTVIELTAISCAIGRVKVGDGNRWGIVDRSNQWVRPVFIEENVD